MHEKRILFGMGFLLLLALNGYFFVAMIYPERGVWYVILLALFGLWYWLRWQKFTKDK